MMFPYYKIFRLLYPNFRWHFKTDKKVIYLTFDDGPVPEVTPWVLDVLKDYDAKATFFCIGENIKKHPEILHSIRAEGHRIGNHTYHHLNGWKTDREEYISNFEDFEKETPTDLFRPPYGRISRSQAKHILQTHQIIMWTALTKDYQNHISPQRCYERAIKGTKSGAIVLFHDSIKAEKKLRYALPKFIEHFSKKGYQFETIPR